MQHVMQPLLGLLGQTPDPGRLALSDWDLVYGKHAGPTFLRGLARWQRCMVYGMQLRLHHGNTLHRRWRWPRANSVSCTLR